MANPTSALGVTGWLIILVIIGISVWPTGKGVRDTLYYKYRPANMPLVAPTVVTLFWISVLVLFDVSWAYLFRITSNTGDWVNHLFKNSPHSWDTMMALYLVTIILIKAWNPWIYFCDKLAFYMDGEFSFEVAAKTTFSTQTNAYKTAQGVGNEGIDTFWEKNDKYYARNYIVKAGMWLYSIALIALTATITGYYSTVYESQKNDHYYKVIYWTAFVGLFAGVLGFLFVIATTVMHYRENENKAEMEKILKRRQEENMSG
jgi:hypothetical protein